ncbi:LysR family transcriptional regulator [Oceanibacterium hippocampi]|uniref:HTH-type transcriptional regulator DmlR n=1 Tax=Oceanibacterium hippocampi TaxID=745714 RepID=A0A1Y5TFH0_9PROT|nr:LysR family transcriptional regulator [Oceanibacterium hippocampi]SLN60690.1 HTH-type transcriptional regulator DmlR [Oceanibacterium hippocampi]
MDRFRELSTFLAVAEEGAFSAAARRLGMSPPAVTRTISALEARLATALFVRTTRRVALTAAGERFRVDAATILRDLNEAEASAAGLHEAPHGRLRVTAPVLFGERFVAPALCDFLDRHPAMTAEAVFLDRIADLIEEGFDVALRIGDLPDSSLVARRVGTLRRIVVAAPAYLDRHGAPQAPKDLARHRIVLATGSGAAGNWDFVRGGVRRVARPAPTLRVNTVSAAIDAAIAGFGIARAFSYQVDAAIARGALVELLAGYESREVPVHLVHQEGSRAAAKIRAFVDFAAPLIRRAAGSLPRPEGA